MQIRFLHDPAKDTGFVGSALSSNMIRFFKKEDDSWGHEVYRKDFSIYHLFRHKMDHEYYQ